jgi:hypothetical protein
MVMLTPSGDIGSANISTLGPRVLMGPAEDMQSASFQWKCGEFAESRRSHQEQPEDDSG